jgi:hypothetical protein
MDSLVRVRWSREVRVSKGVGVGLGRLVVLLVVYRMALGWTWRVELGSMPLICGSWKDSLG